MSICPQMDQYSLSSSKTQNYQSSMGLICTTLTLVQLVPQNPIELHTTLYNHVQSNTIVQIYPKDQLQQRSATYKQTLPDQK